MRLTSIAQLVLLGSLWGSSYLYIKVAVDGMSPLMVVASRLFFGALLLMSVIYFGNLSLPRERIAWLHLVAMAVMGNVIPWTLISWAGQHIDSGISAVLNSMTPLFTILFVVLAFGAERFSIARVVGIALGFTGAVVLAGADVTQLASNSTRGQLAVVASSVCYGLAFAYARRFVRGEPMVLAGCQISLAFLIVAPFTLLFGDPIGTEWTPTRVGAILALGLLTSGVAYILYYRLIRDVGATMASYATYLIPIVGLVLGALVLDEQIGGRDIVGVAFILSGLAVASILHRNVPVDQPAADSPQSASEAPVAAGHDDRPV